MSQYAVIYERAGDGSWSARAADLPVFAVGDSRAEAESEIRSAITFHLEFLAETGRELPQCGQIEVGTVAI